jgi:rhodanese-related sulfurtransferase
MGPFNLTADWGSWISYLVPLLIGLGFGATLEMSGFGDSRKLAAQFYLKDLTVLKVMFTAIIVAATLLGLFSAFGWLSYDGIYVNPTFLIPGLVGGLIMGVGFIVGGFCPGTSLVAAATLKVDGIFFLIGVSLGIFAFGETVGLFDGFWNSTDFGRLTLGDFWGVDTGLVILGVVLMALVMFLLSEISEQYFGRKVKGHSLKLLPGRPLAWGAMATLVILAGITAVKGQPDAWAKWEQIAETTSPKLVSRDVYVHPMEVAELSRNTAIFVKILDIRSEGHFNLFHLKHSHYTTLDDLQDPEFIHALKLVPANTVILTVSNDETWATQAWQLLSAQGIENCYIVEGGINNWFEFFPPPICLAVPRKLQRVDEQPAYDFLRAVGDCCNSAYPELDFIVLPLDCYLAANPGTDAHSQAGKHDSPEPHVPFEHKVKLQAKKAVSGGCS